MATNSLPFLLWDLLSALGIGALLVTGFDQQKVVGAVLCDFEEVS